MSVSGTTWPRYSLLRRSLASCPRTTRHLLGYLHSQGRWAPFLYHELSSALLDRCLARLFCQDCAFFLPGPANNLFSVVDVQRNPAIPSSALLAPHISSPCLDTNEGIGHRATRSPGCWSLQLCQMKHMWKGEPSELLEATGYWIVVRAKLLHVIDETFCSIPTDSGNCRYLDRLTFGASATCCKLAKKGVIRWCAGHLFDD